MEEQEKVKRIELEQNMSWKMYQILTITACTANLIGTICNFCIHGAKLPTIICGICLLMIVIIGIAGWTTKKVQIPAVLIILLLVWFEFPYLYYCYGDASIVYLVLGGRWTGDIFSEKCGDRFIYGDTAGISGDHDE